MNNLYSQLNKPLPSNPQQMLMNLAKHNPQMKQIMNMLQTSGKTPKELFYELAQQQGVDPEQILNMLR